MTWPGIRLGAKFQHNPLHKRAGNQCKLQAEGAATWAGGKFRAFGGNKVGMHPWQWPCMTQPVGRRSKRRIFLRTANQKPLRLNLPAPCTDSCLAVRSGARSPCSSLIQNRPCCAWTFWLVLQYICDHDRILRCLFILPQMSLFVQH